MEQIYNVWWRAFDLLFTLDFLSFPNFATHLIWVFIRVAQRFHDIFFRFIKVAAISFLFICGATCDTLNFRNSLRKSQNLFINMRKNVCVSVEAAPNLSYSYSYSIPYQISRNLRHCSHNLFAAKRGIRSRWNFHGYYSIIHASRAKTAEEPNRCAEITLGLDAAPEGCGHPNAHVYTTM